MVKLALDSSIIIEYLRTGKGEIKSILLDESIPLANLVIPAIVVFELFRGHSMKKVNSENQVNSLLSQIEIAPLTDTIARYAGKLDRDGTVSGNDALIAATCLDLGIPLLTLNTKHFKSIPKLLLWPI